VILPREISGEVADHLNTRIRQVFPVSGGSVSHAARLAGEDGSDFFVKWSTDAASGDSFVEEAFALEQIATTKTVRVPNVIARGERWLMLEWLPGGKGTIAGWQWFGRTLARLHRIRSEQYGWPRANFIGALPQSNEPSSDWAEFFRTQRLVPQLVRAKSVGHFDGSDMLAFGRLFAALPELLAAVGEDGASLLHGDLWIGNACGLADGSVAAIDPASYYGHREVDLAMADLFGGFPREFYSAYDAEWSLQLQGLMQRRAVYQLYYLLVHVNMFGGSYVSSCRRQSSRRFPELRRILCELREE
jgi:fructosamine-3-kinase